MAHALTNRSAVTFGKQRPRSKNKFRVKGLPQSITIIVTTLLVVTITLGFVWKNLLCVDYGYRIASLENQLRLELKLHNELTAEHETLCSPGRIDRLAKKDLGLVAAKVYGAVPLNN